MLLLSAHSFIEIINHNLLLFYFLSVFFFFAWLEWQWQNDSTDDGDQSKLHSQNSCWVPYPVTERSICVSGKSAQPLTFLLEKWKVSAGIPFPLPAFSILTLCSAPRLKLCQMTEENTVALNLRTQDTSFAFEKERKRRKRRRRAGMDVQPRDKGPPDTLHGNQSWYHFLSLYFNIT